jgi:tetraprenyl-beta-curcumene synthase
MSGGTHTRPYTVVGRIKTVLSLIPALATYKRAVLPQVRSELHRWERWTVKIPDLVLRDAALSALKEKSSNVEATAVFAILAPRSQRSSALRAMTALQTTIEYLDILGEQLPDEPLADGLALHRSLVEAVTPGAPYSDWYGQRPQDQDGGYLAELVATCQREVATLPSGDTVRAVAQRAARRCAEGQSYTHAAAGSADGAHELKTWAEGLEEHGDGEYFWWELAAGASSSVALHALIAAAAHREIDMEEAERIDAAYFPPIGALTVLLDDLIDREGDIASGEHNYLDYYPNNEMAAERFALLVRKSQCAVADLFGQHTSILMGVGGFYLSTSGAKSHYARPIRARMLKALGAAVYPILAAMRVLRRD